MDFETITGVIATVISFLISVALIDQIRIVRKNRSSEGISIPAFILVGLSYLAWAIHGWGIQDWYLVLSQAWGFIMIVILFYNILKFREKMRK